jgi:hypothetical protein
VRLVAAEELDIFPAASNNLTVTDPPAARELCRLAVDVDPRLNETVVSAAKIVESVAMTSDPSNNSALPPVADPAPIVAVAVKFVFVLLSVLATTVPPTGERASAVGAFGAIVSITIAALDARFPVVPAVTAGSVKTATFRAPSVIVEPLGLTSEFTSK